MVDQPESVVAHGSVVPLAPTERAAPTQTVRPRPEAPAPEADEATDGDPTSQRVPPSPTDGGPGPRSRTRTRGIVAAVSVLVIVSLWIAISNVADLSTSGRSAVARTLNSAPPTGPAGDLIAEHAAVADCRLVSRDPALYGTFHGFFLHSVAFIWRSPDSRYLYDDPGLRQSIGSQVDRGVANGLGVLPAVAGSRNLITGWPVSLDPWMLGKQVTITFTLDPDNLIPEINENNNTVTVTISVPPDADLVKPERAVTCSHDQ